MATTQNGIYYQDDYTKNADILADMKEMAESVDEVVQEEKENQETIEQKIQELQTEQTAQNKKIEELDDNQIHVTTEKAESINVQDCSGQNAKIKLFGVSKQEGTPSPEFPSQIENTTGNVEITDCNKNIANADAIYQNMKTYNSNYCSEIIKDEKDCIRFNNTIFRPDVGFNLLNFKYKENTSYTIRGMFKKEVESSGNALYFQVLYTDGTKNDVSTSSNEWTELRFVTDGSKTIDKVGFSYGASAYWFLDKSSIFIAEGDTTDYIENEQQTITFPLQKNQKMMEGSRTENDGIHHKRKQFNLSSLTNVSDWTNKGLNENGTYTYFTRATNLMDYKKYVDLKGFCSHFEFFGTTVGTAAMQKKGVGCAFYCTDYDDKLFYINTTIATTEELVAWLSAQETAGTPVMLEYETEEETIEAYTEAQQTAYNQLQNAKTYKTVTNVFTDNAEVEMEYVAHTKTYIDNKVNNMQNQINTINELLSTTNTSAMLLDNMQTDLESEVL